MSNLNGQQIHTLVKHLTDKEVEAVKTRLTGGAKRTFDFLVKTGDSEKMAVASVIRESNGIDYDGMYYKAYCL